MDGDNSFLDLVLKFNATQSEPDHSTLNFSQKTESWSQGTSDSGIATGFEVNNNSENDIRTEHDLNQRHHQELPGSSGFSGLEMPPFNMNHPYFNNGEVTPNQVQGENFGMSVDQYLVQDHQEQVRPIWEQPQGEISELDLMNAPVHQLPQETPWKLFTEETGIICAEPSSAVSSNDVNFEPSVPLPLPLPNVPQKSEDSKRPTQFYCKQCERDYTSSGHLKRHYNSAVHKNTVKHRGNVDPAGLYQPNANPAHDDHQSRPNFASLRGTNRAPAKNAVVSSTINDLLKCVECNKTFRTEGYLKQHINSVHTGEKPFKCPKCGKRFAEETLQWVHTAKHTGQKPHKCQMCPKMFVHKPDLTRHLRSHSDDQQYVCETCGKGFVRKDHMEKHAESHNKRRFYQ